MDARCVGFSPLTGRGLVVLLALVGALTAMCTWAGSAYALDPGPSVDFSFDPVAPLVGQTVTFTAAALPEDGAELVSYRWDLDGDDSFELNTGLVPTATAVYTTPQSLTVTVQMRDSWTNRVTKSKVVTVGAQAPLASFSISPAVPLVNQPVLFTSTSSDPDGAIADQTWDLNGDGLYDNGGGATALRSFAAPGQYVVGLRVVDNEGHASFSSQTVSVVGPGITPSFSLRLLNPFPVVRFSGSLTKRGVHLRRVKVDAPKGSTVRVQCRGRSCPYRNRTSVVSKTDGGLRLVWLEKRLRAGVRITIYVTSPGTIGKYTSFKIRRGKAPLRVDRCVDFGSARPVVC